MAIIQSLISEIFCKSVEFESSLLPLQHTYMHLLVARCLVIRFTNLVVDYNASPVSFGRFYPTGTVANFTCDNGQPLIGANSSKCLSTGYWESIPKCHDGNKIQLCLKCRNDQSGGGPKILSGGGVNQLCWAKFLKNITCMKFRETFSIREHGCIAEVALFLCTIALDVFNNSENVLALETNSILFEEQDLLRGTNYQ